MSQVSSGTSLWQNRHAGRCSCRPGALASPRHPRSQPPPRGVNSGALRALGDYEDAFVWFGRAYREQSNILQYLKVHPFFDPVRADPRFAGMIHDVGLDQAY